MCVQSDNPGFGDGIFIGIYFSPKLGPSAAFQRMGVCAGSSQKSFHQRRSWATKHSCVITAPSVVGKGGRTAGSYSRGFPNLPRGRAEKIAFRKGCLEGSAGGAQRQILNTGLQKASPGDSRALGIVPPPGRPAFIESRVPEVYASALLLTCTHLGQLLSLPGLCQRKGGALPCLCLTRL